MPDFSKLLSKPVDDAKKPKIVPIGTYRGILAKFEYLESKEKKTPYLRYTINATGPGDDIDPSELDGIDLSKRKFDKDFFLTEEADWRLAEFLKTLDLDTSGRSFGEVVPDSLNAPVVFEIYHDPNPKEEGEFFAKISKIYGA